MPARRPTFPLRLRDERLRSLVREVATRDQLSQNELIEQAVEHEVLARGALLAEDLRLSGERLAALTAEQRDRAVASSIEAFAEGEGRPDPMRARAWPPGNRYAHGGDVAPSGSIGVLAAFDAGRR